MIGICCRAPKKLGASLLQHQNGIKLRLPFARQFYKSAIVASFLNNKEIWTVPNIITISRYGILLDVIYWFLNHLQKENKICRRIIASPAITYAIACDMKGIALGGCIISGFSDWLDGYIARTYDQKTVLGAFLDPVADKIFIGSLVLGLTMKGLLPLPLAVIILGRDVILVAASFIMRARERPPGAPFFDTTTSATFEIVPSEFSKINTGCQITLLIVSLGNFALDIPSIDIIEPMWWIISVTTVGSGLGYLDGSGIKRIPKLDEKAKFSPHDK